MGDSRISAWRSIHHSSCNPLFPRTRSGLRCMGRVSLHHPVRHPSHQPRHLPCSPPSRDLTALVSLSPSGSFHESLPMSQLSPPFLLSPHTHFTTRKQPTFQDVVQFNKEGGGDGLHETVKSVDSPFYADPSPSQSLRSSLSRPLSRSPMRFVSSPVFHSSLPRCHFELDAIDLRFSACTSEPSLNIGWAL